MSGSNLDSGISISSSSSTDNHNTWKAGRSPQCLYSSSSLSASSASKQQPSALFIPASRKFYYNSFHSNNNNIYHSHNNNRQGSTCCGKHGYGYGSYHQHQRNHRGQYQRGAGILNSNGLVHCINCGVAGHVYRMCREPITSYGIICFRRNPTTSEVQVVMVQRRDTFAYVEFMRGKYNTGDLPYVTTLLSNMTDRERERLSSGSFEENWRMLWTSKPRRSLAFAKEFQASIEKFLAIREHVIDQIQFNAAVRESRSALGWGFPKGRRMINESDIACATREFFEETGLAPKNIVFVRMAQQQQQATQLRYVFNNDNEGDNNNINNNSSDNPADDDDDGDAAGAADDVKRCVLQEVFTGTNGSKYMHKYYIAVLPDDRSATPLSIARAEMEISEAKWCSVEDAIATFDAEGHPHRSDVLRTATGIVLGNQRLLAHSQHQPPMVSKINET